MPPSYRIALFSGATPLCAGFVVFAAWCITRHEGWEIAGGLIILTGCLLFLVGSVALFRFCRSPSATPNYGQKNRRAFLAATLLLANFPAAAGLIIAALELADRHTIVLHNQSSTTLRDARITGPTGSGVSLHLGDIPPGKTARGHFHTEPEPDGIFTLSAALHGQLTQDCELWPGRNTITVSGDGQIAISSPPPQGGDLLGP